MIQFRKNTSFPVILREQPRRVTVPVFQFRYITSLTYAVT